MTDTDPKPPEEQPPQPPATRSGLDQVAKYSELALVMPAGCAGGWLIGAWLDSKFHTHWIFLAGLAVGFIGGFAQIIRVALRASK